MDAACGRKIMQKRILDILQNTQKVIIGKERVTKLLLTALLADGHVLLEDVPGTGKTRLAKALAASLGIEFGRIQFTPDMLPADITGLHIYDRESGKFVLNKGPVFTNIYWQTRSTARRLGHRRVFWSVWRSDRSLSMEKHRN